MPSECDYSALDNKLGEVCDNCGYGRVDHACHAFEFDDLDGGTASYWLCRTCLWNALTQIQQTEERA